MNGPLKAASSAADRPLSRMTTALGSLSRAVRRRWWLSLPAVLAPLVGCGPPPFFVECPAEIVVGETFEGDWALPEDYHNASLRIRQSSDDGGSVVLSSLSRTSDFGGTFMLTGQSPGTVTLHSTAIADVFLFGVVVSEVEVQQECTFRVVASDGGNGGGNGNENTNGNGNTNANGSNENANDNGASGNENDNGNANAANGNDNGAGGTVTFSDALFDPADWSVMNADLTDTLAANFPQGDPPDPQVAQVEEGGSTLDPAAKDELFRQTITPLYPADVVVRHIHQTAAVDPAEGEISLIEAQMDVIIFDGIPQGRPFSLAPVLIQGNRVWSLAGSNVDLDRPGEWQTLSVGTFGGCFSCGIDLRSGGPITFGFQSASDGISAVRYGVDNWKITVHRK